MMRLLWLFLLSLIGCGAAAKADGTPPADSDAERIVVASRVVERTLAAAKVARLDYEAAWEKRAEVAAAKVAVEARQRLVKEMAVRVKGEPACAEFDLREEAAKKAREQCLSAGKLWGIGPDGNAVLIPAPKAGPPQSAPEKEKQP
jgi:hypothetical protein